MSVENLFNNDEQKKKLKALANLFNPVIQGIRDLELPAEEGELSGDDIVKHLVGVYAVRRKEIIDAPVEIGTNFSIEKRTRTKKVKEEAVAPGAGGVEATTTKTPPESTPATVKTVPAKTGNKGGKSATNKADDMAS